MKCEFGETQFAFGIMRELTDLYFTSKKGYGVPYFPTQRVEKVEGYDAKIEGKVKCLFFQFKVPEKKTTPNSKHWGIYGEPYYIFKIWPNEKSEQHNTLVDLARKDTRNVVCYCAPGFHMLDEFSDNYTNRTISKKSIFVLCKNLNRINGTEKHSISYIIEPRRKSKMHSAEFTIDSLDIETLMKVIESTVPYDNMQDCLFHIAERFSIDIKDVDNNKEMYNRVANHLLIKQNTFMILLCEE